MSSTLAQRRSLFALDKVRDASKIDKFDKLTLGLPAMILQNGFGQTLAFLLAKAKGNENDHHTEAFDIITSWLETRHILKKRDRAEVMKEISQMPQSEYLRAQEEALAILEWVKRYANANLFT
jgi:CRISPR-associated protein Cmr5